MIDYEYEQIEIAYNPRDDREFRMQSGGAMQLRHGFTVAEVTASRANAKERSQLQRTVDRLEADKRYAARCLDTDRQMAQQRRHRLLKRCATVQRRTHLRPDERAELVELDRAGRFHLPASACACGAGIGGGFNSARLIRAAERRLGRSPGCLPGYLTARRLALQSAPVDSREVSDDGVDVAEDQNDPASTLRTGRDFLPLLPPGVGGGETAGAAWSTHRAVGAAARPASAAPFWRGTSAPPPDSARRLTEAGRRQRMTEERDRMERLAGGNMRRFIDSLSRLSIRAGAS